MITTRELREMAARTTLEEFQRRLGPFVLIQRPPKSVIALAAARMGNGQTMRAERAPKAEKSMSLILSFDELVTASLPQLRTIDALMVGRLADCDLVVENPSVSKRHALISWVGTDQHATVKDLGSANGTRIDEVPIGEREAALHDGDVLTFGDADFWFHLTPSLYALLTGKKTGSSASWLSRAS